MRWVCFFLLALACCGVWAQESDASDSAALRARSLSTLSRAKAVASVSAAARAGSGGESTEQTGGPVRGSQLPPKDPAASEELKVIHAGFAQVAGANKLIFDQGVVLEFRGYTMSAERIEGDRETSVWIMRGGGKLTGKGESVSGEEITVNFDEETYTFKDGEGTVTPERAQGATTGPLYVTGGSGRLTSRHYHIVNGTLTPGDREDPHFGLEVDSAEVIPGKRISLKGLTLRIGGRKVARLSSLVIPLYDDRPRYLPEFGQSPDEGYYIKSRYVTPLRGDDTWETRLDLMSRLGVGLGGDLRYSNSVATGLASIYGLSGSQRTLVGSWDHTQKLSFGTLTLGNQYQRANYLTAPGTTSVNSRAQLLLPSRYGQSTLAYTRFSSAVQTFESVSETYSLQDSRQVKGFKTNLSLNLSSSESKSGITQLSKSERVDVRVQGTKELRSLTADLLYQRSIPVGDQNSFSSASDRTPLLTLTSDTTRLFGSRVGRVWPFQTSFSIGELNDPGSKSQITRMTFDAKGGRTEELGKSLKLTWNSLFSQGMYSDDTAQYVLGYNGNLAYSFSKNSSMTLSYRNQRQFGFTPLAIDLTGRSDAFQYGLDWRLGRGWGVTAQTGYDILSADRGQSPWQLVSLGASYRVNDSRFTFTSIYDTFNTAWSSFRAESQFLIGGTKVATAARYDGLRSVWSAASLQVEALRLGKVRTDFLMSFNGFTKQFDAMQVSLAYDLHCTEAVLEFTEFRSGFRSGRQIAFFFRIKALPFGGDFGTGRQGQRIGGAGGFGG